MGLDKAKLLTGSDARTAQILGMSKHHISDVRAGRRKLTPYQAARLAELIGEPWHAGALARLEELAASEEERQFWRGKSRTLAQTVARAGLAAFLILGGVLHVPSGNAGVLIRSADQTIYCAPSRQPMNGRSMRLRRRGQQRRSAQLWALVTHHAGRLAAACVALPARFSLRGAPATLAGFGCSSIAGSP